MSGAELSLMMSTLETSKTEVKPRWIFLRIKQNIMNITLGKRMIG